MISTQAVVALVFANVAVLVGALFFGWSIAEVFWIYWAETGVIGFYNILRMIVVKAPDRLKMMLIPLFIIHYGAFMAGNALFLGVVVFNPALQLFPEDNFRSIFIAVGISVGFLLASHGLSFYTNYVRDGEYKTALLPRLMFAPYIRIFIMWTIIMVAYFWLAILLVLDKAVPDGPTIIFFTVLLVVLKCIADLVTHVVMHLHRQKELGKIIEKTLKNASSNV